MTDEATRQAGSDRDRPHHDPAADCGRPDVGEQASGPGEHLARARTAASSAYRAAGVIEGFTARVNPSKVGLEIAALIFVNADQHGWKALQHKLLDLPGLEHLALATGPFDFCLLVRVPDMQTLRDVVLERLQAMTEVRSTQTAFDLDEQRPPPMSD